MAEPGAMSPELEQFIESMGVYFEHYGVPRIGGRVIGLLIAARRPLSLDDMAEALRVSRASVSTNVRMAMNYGLAELVTFPGDRRDYYRYPDNAWERDILVNIEAIVALRRLAKRGLAATAPDNQVARARLDELRDFCDFTLGEMHGWLERWREHRAARDRG